MSTTAAAPIARLRETDVQEIVGRLVREFSPRAIYLFGSHVYGTPHRDSDVDVLVIFDDPAPDRIELAKRGYVSLHGLDLPVELHFATATTFERFSTVIGSFHRDVKQRGRVVYAA